ncbi:nicotinamide riboside kinase 1-like isoform X1 [Colossoma macropomum]|uniref:nicotinamide riboside kinase 1-like isoform X1 n=1 Tax=Colossoma macropomum TaxID=42526 RepID=UPI0018642DE0|nr:nicotinamide riboside kinase 1-like isoform X1 [Colossoma macropomum]
MRPGAAGSPSAQELTNRSASLASLTTKFQTASGINVSSRPVRQKLNEDDSVVPVDSHGFKQYDTLDAIHMDRMMSKVKSWVQDPQSFMLSQGLSVQESSVFSLIVEGFLIFNYGPLNELFDKRYFLQIPYETCKLRRSSRVYVPPDPVGYFDGHVWPMYLKNRKEMENMVQDLVFLDGNQKREDLLATVYKDIQQMFTAG